MKTNFLIIGSGISGLNFALHSAKKGEVTIVTKKKLIDSNTNFAQGGIAAVLDKTDNAKKHIKDTLEAGAYHNNKKTVKFMVDHSADAIYRLIDLGVEFANDKGELRLTQEGGHGHRRIAYVGDYTGKEIERILVKRVKEHPNITILEDAFGLCLLTKKKTCFGAQIIKNNKIENIFADQTIMATGGAGQLFEHTTNPKIATGDGIAMAVNAGCKVKDMEFIQFHPTALDKNTFPKFLISETVRGEDAKIVNEKGERIMEGIHPKGDLAPRDVVAREIYKALKKGKVFLDITNKKRPYLKKRFPQIYEKLKKYGYKMEKDLIPVVPAAHYICGGIVTNLKGHTKVKRLYAFGEVTYTGVHGANRLASNSLLEALVFSNQVAEEIEIGKAETKHPEDSWKKQRLIFNDSKQTKQASSIKKDIQKIMWEYAGIARDRKQIKGIAMPIMKQLIKDLQKINGTNQEIEEARNMAQVSLLILSSASARRKSLGCHFVK